jgi:FixJ family two-component response regulator
MAVSSQSVVILDDDDDMRETLCELFRSEGATCHSVGSLEALIALGARGLRCDLAILDFNLGVGRPSGVDAYRWLKERSFPGRIVFLTGHARSYPGVAEAYASGVKVLEKPTSTAELLGLLDGGAAATV